MTRVTRLLLVTALLVAPQPPTATDLVNQLQTILDQLRASVFVPPPVLPVTVTTAAELQSALDSLAPLIVVAPGVYRGNFLLTNKPTPTIVRGLQFEGRAAPGFVYPQLVAQDPLVPVLRTAPGAHDYTFVGLEFTGVAPDRNVIEIGVNATTLEQLPRNITFDRVYIHGTTPPFGHRGIYFDVINGIVRDSYFDSFVEQGRDSNAIGVFGGAGPYLIENNWIEASGEGMLVGGSDPTIPGLIPSDLVIRNNVFVKPLAWKPVWQSADGVLGPTWSSGATLVSGYPGSVKNSFELKNARRVTITGNRFEHVWADAQSGSAVLFTVRNQDGGCPWCTIEDVTFACNTIVHAAHAGINILATDNNHPSGTLAHLRILRNLFVDVASGIQIGDGGTGIEIAGNVLLHTRGSVLSFWGRPTLGFRFTGNFVTPGAYGIVGDNTGVGTPSLTAFAPGSVFTGNTIETTPARFIPYPPGNTIVPPGTVTASDWSCTP